MDKRGFRNPGSLCYLIAPLLQTLSYPSVFNILLSQGEDNNNQLLKMLHNGLFGDISETATDDFVLEVWKEFYQQKDGDMHTQRDASEFHSDLMTRLCVDLKATEFNDNFSASVLGTMVNILAEKSGENKLERPERFFQISVNVGSSSTGNNLRASLQDYTKEEVIPFRWSKTVEHASADAAKVQTAALPTAKSTRFRSLPKHLVFHLKRFRFDVKTMQKVKLHHRFEFPDVLDMAPYMEETAAAPASSCLYRLSGVIVHKGKTAYEGHYYSFIRDRDVATGMEGSEESGSWYRYNDHRVEPATAASMERESLGGITSKASCDIEVTENIDGAAAAEIVRHSGRHRSAFMLFYDRIET